MIGTLATYGQAPVTLQTRDTVLDYTRPRIALAADGSFAVAMEAFVETDFGFQRWEIAVQRYAPSGAPVGPAHFFDGESCGSLDIWTSDFMEHAELAFRPDGILLVLMQHTGQYSIVVTDVSSAEATLAAIDQAGQVIDLNSAGNCLQKKLIFPGGSRQDRPRMALAPNAFVLVTVDGFFNDSDLRNVGLRILDGDLEQQVDLLIPHDDPASTQAFHMVPDVATNGSAILSVWQECPIIDNQGNADACDVGAQFAFVGAGGALQVTSPNVRVNAGDPAGTISFNPSADMNAAGNSVVVWTDTRTGSQGDIFAQRFDAAGQPVGGNLQVSAGEGVIQRRAEVAMLNDGRFMVAWTDSSAAGFRARGRRFLADGSPEGPAFSLLNSPGYESGLPALASNGSAYVYTWLAEKGGSSAVYTSNVGVVVATEPEPAAPPAATMLLEGYPNPFAEQATLTYRLPVTGAVLMNVYDVLGREVARLVDRVQEAGTHTTRLDGGGLPPGLYVVRLQQGAVRQAHLLSRLY